MTEEENSYLAFLQLRVMQLRLVGESVYVSGPMSGIPLYNFPAFRLATQLLRDVGVEAISPAEMDEADGVTPDPEGTATTAEQYAEFLARDIKVMAERKIKAVILLRGWETSGGAQTEIAFARAIGAAVYTMPNLQPLDNRPTTKTPGATRVVNEKTGGQKDAKPQRMSLIPVDALQSIAEVYDFGTRKYAPHNWRLGYNWSLSYDALSRHLQAFWRGEDLDPESGLPHLAHAGFHVLTLLTFSQDSPDLDDRYIKHV